MLAISISPCLRRITKASSKSCKREIKSLHPPRSLSRLGLHPRRVMETSTFAQGRDEIAVLNFELHSQTLKRVFKHRFSSESAVQV
jgi:hypothetical protein